MSSSRLISRRKQDQGFKWARVGIAVLSTIGLIDTGSITLNKWGIIGSLSCPGGIEGCDKVLNSPWGMLIQNNAASITLPCRKCFRKINNVFAIIMYPRSVCMYEYYETEFRRPPQLSHVRTRSW